MRVFVGYGYNERDTWIETLILPLIEAFGSEPVHGKTVFGGALANEVVQLIRASDAMIGFTTRRDEIGGGRFSTHPWVVSELNAAFSQNPGIPFVEVREDGVAPSGGAFEAANYQRIDYTEADRASCLLQVAQALRRFCDQTRVIRVRLRPESIIEEIDGLLYDPSFVCRCQTYARGIESSPRVIPVVPVKGNLEVQLRDVGDDDLVRITISAAGRTWRSDYESVDTVDIRLKS